MNILAEEKVTIQDIADRAGVSISTVSRVLNKNSSVRESYRIAVEEAVEALNYQPNIFARGLAGGQSKTIGVITQHITSPFFDLILRGILEEMTGSEYQPIFADGQWRTAKERQSLQTFIERRVDGLIVLGGTLPEAELAAVAARLPIIVIGRQLSSLPNACLPLDSFGGAYAATTHLIEQGHQRIVHLTGIMHHSDAQQRLAGYKQALLDGGLAVEDRFILEGDFSEQSGVMAVERLLSSGPIYTAMFAANDQMAMGVRLALYRRGIRVPDDISIIGFDDQPASAFMTPPLTTVRQPALEIGRSAAQRILQKILTRPEEIETFKAKLIVRDSVTRCY